MPGSDADGEKEETSRKRPRSEDETEESGPKQTEQHGESAAIQSTSKQDNLPPPVFQVNYPFLRSSVKRQKKEPSPPPQPPPVVKKGGMNFIVGRHLTKNVFCKVLCLGVYCLYHVTVVGCLWAALSRKNISTLSLFPSKLGFLGILLCFTVVSSLLDYCFQVSNKIGFNEYVQKMLLDFWIDKSWYAYSTDWHYRKIVLYFQQLIWRKLNAGWNLNACDGKD